MGGYGNRLYRTYSDSLTANQLRNAVLKNRFDLLHNPDTSHPAIHGDKTSDVELLEYLVTDDESKQKTSSTKFLDKQWKTSYMGVAIIQNANDIVEWVNYRNNERPKYNKITGKNEILVQQKKFSADIHPENPNEFVGKGFMVDPVTKRIGEYLTNKVSVIIRNEPRRDFGLSVYTSYPNISDDPNSVPTHRDLTDLLKQTNAYKTATPVGKAVLEYKVSDCDISKVRAIKVKDDKSDPRNQKIIIRLATNNPNFAAVVNISESKFIMGIVDCNTKAVHETYDLNKEPFMLSKDYPEEAKWICHMKDTVDGASKQISTCVQRLPIPNVPEPEVEVIDEQYSN